MPSSPLSYWDSLSKGIQAAIKTGRVGTPVFVRWTVLAARNASQVESILGEMSIRVREWLGAAPDKLYALGKVESGSIALNLEFTTGQTALLTAGLSHTHTEVDLTLLGSDGTIYHHEFPFELGDGSFEVHLDEDADYLLTQIHASLHSGKPVVISKRSLPHA